MKMLDETRFKALHSQMQFVAEIDKAKSILRRNKLADGSRRENDAEHSWHLCMMALVLQQYANEPVDINHVIQMLLVHDIVEIDAGDTFAYDETGQKDKIDRERKAAERIFGMLPPEQGEKMRQLWEEFEARETVDAKFAAAIDRLQPIMLNYLSEGFVWKHYGIPADRVLSRNKDIKEGSEKIWEYAKAMIDQAISRGYLKP